MIPREGLSRSGGGVASPPLVGSIAISVSSFSVPPGRSPSICPDRQPLPRSSLLRSAHLEHSPPSCDLCVNHRTLTTPAPGRTRLCRGCRPRMRSCGHTCTPAGWCRRPSLCILRLLPRLALALGPGRGGGPAWVQTPEGADSLCRYSPTSCPHSQTLP